MTRVISKESRIDLWYPAEMISVDDARARILASTLASTQGLREESCFLGEAQNRVLAVDAVSLRSLPSRDNSAMDGYGIRAADVVDATDAAPTTLTIAGRVLPGDGGSFGRGASLKKGEAVRIMTGANIPPGVDAVVMRENTNEENVVDHDDTASGKVEVRVAVRKGEAIRLAGEDVEEGKVILPAGTRLGPAQINLLVAAGHVVVKVRRKPVVAILASGDELRELGTKAGADDIINSNAHAVASAVKGAGGIPQLIGIAHDTLEDHVAHIDTAASADILITIGGVSMGTHDFVRPAFSALGVELDFWKVAMRPGKPLAFGRRGNQLVFGLPGNPVSTLVGFELFVRPTIATLLGETDVVKQLLNAKLVDGQMKKRPGLRFFARASVSVRDGALVARLRGKQGSGQTSGMAHANALVVIPEDIEEVKTGDDVKVMLLDERALFVADSDDK